MTTSTREEAIRKTLHVLLSLGVAAAVWRLPRVEAATLLAAATCIALGVELARRTDGRFRLLFHSRLGRLLRERELDRLTGATTLAMGYTLTVLAFPLIPAVAGVLITGVADAVAAVVGKRYGRLRYPGGKSMEGSLAFLILVTALLAFLVPALHPLAVLGIALTLTAVEGLSLAVHDNLYLPPTAAAAVHAAGLLSGVTFFS